MAEDTQVALVNLSQSHVQIVVNQIQFLFNQEEISLFSVGIVLEKIGNNHFL